MALAQPVPSGEMWNAYRRDLEDLGYKEPVREEMYVHVDALSPEQVAANAGIAAASQVGCRFYVDYEEQEPVCADMTMPELYNSAELRMLKRGEKVQAAWALIRSAQALPDVQVGDYELRVLSIPSLLFEGFRLRSLDGRPDLVMPLVTIGPELKDKTVFSMDELWELLQPLAVRRLSFYEPGPL